MAAAARRKQRRAAAGCLLRAQAGLARARGFLKDSSRYRAARRAGHPFLDNTTPSPPATPASAKKAPATGLAALVSTAKPHARASVRRARPAPPRARSRSQGRRARGRTAGSRTCPARTSPRRARRGDVEYPLGDQREQERGGEGREGKQQTDAQQCSKRGRRTANTQAASGRVRRTNPCPRS